MTTTNTANGHDTDCMCGPCMTADMDATIIANGLNPADYTATPVMDVSERTRYAKPGQKCGTGRVRRVSDKQVAFIKRLLRERDTSALKLPVSVTPEVLANVETISLRGASDLIDRLLACPELPAAARPVDTATDRQIAYVRSLIDERSDDPVRDHSIIDDVINAEMFSKQRASSFIDVLRKAPKRVHKPAQSEPAETVTDGMYLVDGTVYKVQRAVHGSGKLYAKMLDVDGFAYAPGMIRKLRPEHKMSLEQAREYGKLYGQCVRCGRELTDENSIEAGIGPVCASKF